MRTDGGKTRFHTGSRRLRTRFNDRIAEAAHRIGPLGRAYDELYFQYRLRIAAPRATWNSLRRFPAADVLVDQAADWLGSLGQQPFFLWLHFMDPHAPYYPSAAALQATGGHIQPGRGRYLNAAWTEKREHRIQKYRDDIVQLYDAGIRWVDAQVARLADRLRDISLWDSSVFVLTADHGEEFLDHGGRFHYPARPYHEMLHVPLLLPLPGTKKIAISPPPLRPLHLPP